MKLNTGMSFCSDMCQTCILYSTSKVVRSALRFVRKYYAAHLLSATMFAGNEGGTEVLNYIRESALYKSGDAEIRDVMQKEVSSLQIWVRDSWGPGSNGTDSFKLFMSTVVRPCLKVTVRNIPSNLQDCGVVNLLQVGFVEQVDENSFLYISF